MSDLSELGPPRKGAEPGFYPDPLGGRSARWWDGNQWTHTVGPRVEPGSTPDAPVPPPTRVCRRCAARTETFAAKCPNCGRPYGQLPLWQAIAVAIAAGLLTLGGCGACVIAGVKGVEDELDRYAISRAEYEAVPAGATQAQVERRLWAPYLRDRVAGLDCITYNDEGGSVFRDQYEFCFRDGRLVSRERLEFGD